MGRTLRRVRKWIGECVLESVNEQLVRVDGPKLVMVEHRTCHAAVASSISRCGKGFSSQSHLSVQTLFTCPHTPVCNPMHYHLCTH